MAQNLTNQRPMSNYKAGTRAGVGVNDAPVHNGAKSTHNLFPMSYQLCTTARYAEIAPFFVFNAEAKDQIPLKSAFELRTLALNSPMMSRLFMKRAYFEVKQNAVLPRTFEYIYKNPIHGDDVPADAYCNVGRDGSVLFTNALMSIYMKVLQLIDDQTEIETGGMTVALRDAYIVLGRVLFLLESIYSSGSLLANLGCPLNGYANVGLNSNGFDTWISDQIDTFITGGISGDLYRQVPVFSFPELLHFKDQENQTSLFSCVPVAQGGNDGLTIQVVSKNRLIELLRSYTPENVRFFDSVSGTEIEGENSISNYFDIPSYGQFNLPAFGIDLMRIAAYQLVCAEWYTNDKVDYIYNADLWRKSMDFFVKQFLGSVDFFEYNDISIMYDALSAHNFDAMASKAFGYDPSGDSTNINLWLDYLSNIFFYNRSLKFEDYFSGSRTRPLAVGENTISDASDPIEVVRGIQLTRFLNAVNRSGLDEKYLKEIYGTLPLPSDLIPRWITTIDNQIESFEVNNTGDEQGKMTTALRTQVGTDEGSTSVVIEGYPSILLGLFSFEVPRLYVDAIDRDFFVQDRFDMFNPYFQYDGDQAIYRDELYPITGEAAGTSFAYTGRDNHRKLRVSRATGGFVKNLPSWSFIVDDQKNGIPYAHLNPEFILSSCTEFDRFFGSLTGFTLDSYFHFILSFVNDCNAYRAMEYSPAILNG